MRKLERAPGTGPVANANALRLRRAGVPRPARVLVEARRAFGLVGLEAVLDQGTGDRLIDGGWPTRRSWRSGVHNLRHLLTHARYAAGMSDQPASANLPPAVAS